MRNGDGHIASVIAAEVTHTAAISLHVSGIVEQHLGVILNLPLTSADGHKRAGRTFLESHHVGEVTRHLATCVVAHTDGDVVVAILVDALSGYEALQAWMIGVERARALFIDGILGRSAGDATIQAGAASSQIAGVALLLNAQHVVVLHVECGVHARTDYIRYDNALLGRTASGDGHVQRVLLAVDSQHTLIDGRCAVVVDGDEQGNLVLVALEGLVVVGIERHRIVEGIAEIGCRLVQL